MEKIPEQRVQAESKLEQNIIEHQIVSADINRALALIATRQINAEDHWTRKALCSAGVDPNIFDPLDKDTAANEKAKRYCGACAVQEYCRETAMAKDKPELAMIWGGLTASERKKILRNKIDKSRRNSS